MRARFYRSARTAPNYASWPFDDVLEARIAAAEDNAARFADDNPLNDPLLWLADGHICRGCHQDL